MPIPVLKTINTEDLNILLVAYLRGLLNGEKRNKLGDIYCNEDKEEGYTECYVSVEPLQNEIENMKGKMFDEENNRYWVIDYLDEYRRAPVDVIYQLYKDHKFMTITTRVEWKYIRPISEVPLP